jgi:hypothetical protein
VVIAIDVKTLKGSRGQGNKALHIFNAWVSENQLVLGQLEADEK